MSVLVPSITNTNHHHSYPHSSYFSNTTTRRINGNISQTKQTRLTTKKLPDCEPPTDHVPHGVVNSMKQRFLDKVNESLLLNNNSTLARHSLSKPSSRILSNENLLQTKTSLSPLKHTVRLSRSQDNLSNDNKSNHYIPSQIITTNEQFTSYIQPKQDVIIVDTTPTTANESNDEDDKLHIGQKTQIHRQSYTELHVDEAPKPGTVTTVKNMFERQIRLSRYDADKLFNTSTPSSSRVGSQHREITSPTRSRSISPNDMALRQRRTSISTSTLPLPTATTISLPVPTSYPDLVISHTPPTETNRNANEQISNENLLINTQGLNKDKKIYITNRNTNSHEQSPLSVIVDECSTPTLNHQRPNLLLPSTSSVEIVDCQPLDFKSRLALFNRTNTQQSNENSANNKKHSNTTNSLSTNLLTKPVVYQHPVRLINEEKKDLQPETIHPELSISISRSVINTAKAVTFYGGNKLNGNTNSSLPSSIPPPPPPPSVSQTNIKNEQSSVSTSIDVCRVPDIIGGNVKLNKSSIFSGAKKNARVQFIDNIDTFEYPSFEIAMAELGSTGSDNDNDMEEDEDEDNDPSNMMNGDDHILTKIINEKIKEKQAELVRTNNHHSDDVDDDELDRLARINAQFNTNTTGDQSIKPKGTLHTFRPTHLDQYVLGTQHGSMITSKTSDMPASTNSYSILARQKLLSPADVPIKTVSNHSILKQQVKSTFDMTNNIQWSSMSTTTDLLF